MLNCPQVTLPASAPAKTATPLVPVPVEVFPLKLPRKFAAMPMAAVVPLVVKVLFVMLAVPAFAMIPIPLVPMPMLSKLLAVVVGAAPWILIPNTCRLNVLLLMLGAVPAPATKTPVLELSVMALLLRVGEAFPVAISSIPLTEDPPKRTAAFVIDPVAPPAKTIPPQSPAAGLLVVPSPLVSPPKSSRREVNITFCVPLPLAIRPPATCRNVGQNAWLVWNFTTTPGEMVRVTPEGMVRPPQRGV